MVAIRRLMTTDYPQVLSLNAEAQPHVAPLDETALGRLHAVSQAHLVAEDRGAMAGYVLAFARDDPYDGDEFLALSTLIPRPFIYIDQVATQSSMRRSGIARRLYGALESRALAIGAHSLCCEVNTSPPNPGSLAFHQRMDFRQVGSLATRDGRIVALLQKQLAVAV
jgi:predicted GNAT superfamily acetyltransferase